MLHAVDGINFKIKKGTTLGVVGESGCGKSTLLNLISGLLTPEKGSIYMGDQPVGTPNTRIGYMLQKDHLLEWRSVYRNIILGLEIRHQLTPAKKELADAFITSYDQVPKMFREDFT